MKIDKNTFDGDQYKLLYTILYSVLIYLKIICLISRARIWTCDKNK